MTTAIPTKALAAPRSLQNIYATKPTAFTRWLRVSLVWQLIRFVVLNLKMIRIIARSHRAMR